VTEPNWQAFQRDLLASLLGPDEDQALRLTRGALAGGVTPEAYLSSCITPVMEEVGRRFEELEIFLPELVSAGEIVQHITESLLKPAILAASRRLPASAGTVLLATVQGDLHDIGKNMVALTLEVNGFDVVDLGTNVPPPVIVKRSLHEGVDIIGLSSLLTTCLPYMKDVLDLLAARGARHQCAVIVGGAAPTPEYAAAAGFDAQGHSAAEAVTICKRLMAARR
jgi:trimethylamine corrinoid protein